MAQFKKVKYVYKALIKLNSKPCFLCGNNNFIIFAQNISNK